MKNDPPCAQYLENKDERGFMNPGCHCHGKTFCPDKTYVMGEDDVPVAYWTEDLVRMEALKPFVPDYQI